VKLLLDENLSHRLIGIFEARFPGSAHVCSQGLRGATDAGIWQYARSHELAITSKDTDFREKSLVEGYPPKVVWLDVGNARTSEIRVLIERERERIERFLSDDDASLLVLSHSPQAQ
jgi:predicted nuclease of predicted toxin-antitoxin system